MKEQTKNPKSKDVIIPVPAKSAEKSERTSRHKRDNEVIGDEAVEEKQIAHGTKGTSTQSQQTGEGQPSKAALDQEKYDRQRSKTVSVSGGAVGAPGNTLRY